MTAVAGHETRGENRGDVAIAVRGLVAGYDGVPAVHGIDLTVHAGEVVALLGANGAGKSTTLLAVAGLVEIQAGEIEVAGTTTGCATTGRATTGRSTSARRTRRLARAGLALVPEDRSLFPTLTARQTLRVATGRGRAAAAVDDAVGWFPPLERVLDRPAQLLSGGEQQMLALARALVRRPRALMIDEMSLGLAPLVVDALLPVVRAAASEHGTGVLLVEQHVPAALAVADRGYVLRSGRVAVEGDAATLRADPGLLAASYLGTT
jgi:branched-chain amino acid transport system ATP-binding protein